MSMRLGGEAGMDLPFDVEIEILQRLPVRPLRRFELVSKKWRSLITSQYFMERYLVRQKSKHRFKILANFMDPFSRLPQTDGRFRSRGKDKDDPEFSYVLLHHNNEGSSLSCDGFICCPRPGKQFLFMNPATLQIIQIEEPPLSHRPKTFESHGPLPITFFINHLCYIDETPYPKFHLLGFGRDRVSGDYKLVRLFPWLNIRLKHRICSECEVLSLKTRKWTYISPVPIPCPDGKASASVNGSIYWFTCYLWVRDSLFSTTAKIIAFDLHTHRFRAVSHPPIFDARRPSDGIQLVNLRDQVWIVEQTPSCLDMWSMDGAWEKMYSIDLKCCGISELKVTPIEICNYGKVLIKVKKPEDSNHWGLKERLLKYDPLTKTLLFSDHQTYASLPNYQTRVLAPYFESLFSLY